MGRPSKYSEEVVQKLCEALEQGVPRKWACAAAGISDQTLTNWLKAEQEGEECFLGFWDRIKEAEDKAVVFHLLNIKKHCEKAWTCSAWWLERTHPEDFARQRLELSGPGGGPIQHEIAPIRFIVVPPANAGISSEE